MKQVYELRFGDEIIGVFPNEKSVVKAMSTYIEYLKINNDLKPIEIPAKMNKYSMIMISNGIRLFTLERDLFQTNKDFKKYLGLC